MILIILIATHFLIGECIWLDARYHYVPKIQRFQKLSNTDASACLDSCMRSSACKAVGMNRGDYTRLNGECYFIYHPPGMLEKPKEDSNDNLIVLIAVDENNYKIQYFKHVEKEYPTEIKQGKLRLHSTVKPTKKSGLSKLPRISKGRSMSEEYSTYVPGTGSRTNSLTQKPDTKKAPASITKTSIRSTKPNERVTTIQPLKPGPNPNTDGGGGIVGGTTVGGRNPITSPTPSKPSGGITEKPVTGPGTDKRETTIGIIKTTAKAIVSTGPTEKACIFHDKAHGGNPIKKIYGIPNFAECRVECRKVTNCIYYSWWKDGQKKHNCFLRKFNGGLSKSNYAYSAHRACSESCLDC